jgi:hypothetical protein
MLAWCRLVPLDEAAFAPYVAYTVIEPASRASRANSDQSQQRPAPLGEGQRPYGQRPYGQTKTGITFCRL